MTQIPKNGLSVGSVPVGRQWIGKLLLGAPAAFRGLRRVPLLGDMIHKLSHRLVGSGEIVWTQVQAGPARGLWLELNPRTGQDYLRGNVELASQQVMKERLHPGDVFYDLGANIGLFSLLAARMTGETGKVFSFEPDPENAARLRRNAQHNGFSNIAVVQAGVWSSSGKRTFSFADASSPDRGVGKFATEENGTNRVALDCVALDNFIERTPLPDGIKCDVEGAEVEVLRGAERILSEVRPWIICELHSEENSQMVRHLLRAAGYRIEQVDATHVLAVAK